MSLHPSAFYRLLIPSAAIASLLTFTGPGLAQTSQEMLKKAETGCLESRQRGLASGPGQGDFQ
jgi:hypothetical protein